MEEELRYILHKEDVAEGYQFHIIDVKLDEHVITTSRPEIANKIVQALNYWEINTQGFVGGG